MNILVDMLAEKGMKLGINEQRPRPTFSTTVISLYNSEDMQIINLREYMVEQVNGAMVGEYYRKRKGWTRETLECIEWEGIESTLKPTSPLRRTKLIQMLHNWQNVGAQKGKFRDARIKINSDNPLPPTEEEITCHLCPEGCGEEERELHYLHCPTTAAKEKRSRSAHKAMSRLKKIKTHEGITSIVGMILTKVGDDEKVELTQELRNEIGDP